MDTLKKFFPYSFQKKKKLGDLIVNILVQLLAEIVIGALISILAKVPVVNLVTGLAGGLLGLYILVGIVLSVLDYMKILK